MVVGDLGLIEGFPDGEFGGEKTVTRYQWAVMLARLYDCLKRSYRPVLSLEVLASHGWPIDDVPFDHWAYNDVQDMRDLGVLDARGEKGFEGDQDLLRGELEWDVRRLAGIFIGRGAARE